jgi:hypothetical protein
MRECNIGCYIKSAKYTQSIANPRVITQCNITSITGNSPYTQRTPSDISSELKFTIATLSVQLTIKASPNLN